MVIKHCFVPICQNNSYNSPTKLFIRVPPNLEVRKRWYDAVYKEDTEDVPKTTMLYCCEDHFDLPNDVDNWTYFKMFGTKIIMKKNVVPHIFLPKKDLQSQLSEQEKELKRKLLENYESVKCEFSPESKKSKKKKGRGRGRGKGKLKLNKDAAAIFSDYYSLKKKEPVKSEKYDEQKSNDIVEEKVASPASVSNPSLQISVDNKQNSTHMEDKLEQVKNKETIKIVSRHSIDKEQNINKQNSIHMENKLEQVKKKETIKIVSHPSLQSPVVKKVPIVPIKFQNRGYIANKQNKRVNVNSMPNRINPKWLNKNFIICSCKHAEQLNSHDSMEDDSESEIDTEPIVNEETEVRLDTKSEFVDVKEEMDIEEYKLEDNFNFISEPKNISQHFLPESEIPVQVETNATQQLPNSVLSIKTESDNEDITIKTEPEEIEIKEEPDEEPEDFEFVNVNARSDSNFFHEEPVKVSGTNIFVANASEESILS